MKKIVLIAGIMWAAVNPVAVAGIITGTVVAEVDGRPVAGVSVEAQDCETGGFCGTTTTNAIGYYAISGLARGTYWIRVLTWNTDFAPAYYENTPDSDRAMRISVSATGVVQNIDFKLALGGMITGVVTDLAGAPIPNLWIGAVDYYNSAYRNGTHTDTLGYYELSRLPAGTYRVNAATQTTDYIGEWYDNALDHDDAAPTVVPKGGVVQGINFSLAGGGLKVSGRVTDKATGLPLAGVRVSYWHDGLQRWNSTFTDAEGRYSLTGLVGGEVYVGAEPESYYAWIGTQLELVTDIDSLDFELPRGASLSGKVVDLKSGLALGGVEVTYWHEVYATWRSVLTGDDGRFAFSNLPPGAAEVEARPSLDTGYARNPYDCSWVRLWEGQIVSDAEIPLQRGALVCGFITDASGDPLSDVECQYGGRMSDGDCTTDDQGQYQVRLPVGTYALTVDTDDLGALPQVVTITDVNLPVNGPVLVAYSEQTGGQISGSVDAAAGYPETGAFAVCAIESERTMPMDPDALYYSDSPVLHIDLHQAGPFTVNSLALGVPYDVLLLVSGETPEGFDYAVMVDAVHSVSLGETGIVLNYRSQGSKVAGRVLDTDGEPVLGARIFLGRLPAGDPAGFAEVDTNGDFALFSVPSGTYTVTALHSACLEATVTVTVTNEEPASLGTITMSYVPGTSRIRLYPKQ